MTAPDGQFVPEAIADLPPSSKLVAAYLSMADGWVAWDDIEQETRLSQGTIKHALAALREADTVERRQSLRDGRKVLYRLSTSGGPSD